MSLPGGHWEMGAYRYGFNGKENDPETHTQDYGFRTSDPLTGRFWSVDPLTKKYPELSSYQFASNRPIDGMDLDGKEWVPVNDKGDAVSQYSPDVKSYKWVGYDFITIERDGPLGLWTDKMIIGRVPKAGSVAFGQAVYKERNESFVTIYGVDADGEPITSTSTRAPWVQVAFDEKLKDVREGKEKGSNPDIVSYLSHPSIERQYRSNSEATPWCAAFANYTLLESGYYGPAVNPLAVQNWNGTWRKWDEGIEIKTPVYGAFVTLGDDHIGMVVGMNGDNIYILGGNQGNAITVMERKIASNYKFFVPKNYKVPPLDGDKNYLQNTYNGSKTKVTTTR
jgi:uncharacterized protein (TIGR02594 family)